MFGDDILWSTIKWCFLESQQLSVALRWLILHSPTPSLLRRCLSTYSESTNPLLTTIRLPHYKGPFWSELIPIYLTRIFNNSGNIEGWCLKVCFVLTSFIWTSWDWIKALMTVFNFDGQCFYRRSHPSCQGWARRPLLFGSSTSTVIRLRLFQKSSKWALRKYRSKGHNVVPRHLPKFYIGHVLNIAAKNYFYLYS